MMENIIGSADATEENEWISFSDLMAVMMVIFVFIAIIYFDRVPKNQQQIIEQKKQLQLELTLLDEEKENLEILKQELLKDLREAERVKQSLEDQAKVLRAEASDLQDQKDTVEENMNLALDAVARAEKAKQVFTNTLIDFKTVESDIYEALILEFENDLTGWDAEIIRDNLIFRFKSPEVLFPANEYNLTPEFEKILGEFVPRYVSVLQNFSEYIDEIRVEGHTSSEFSSQPTALGKYISNMELSQDRTRSVTDFALRALNDDRRAWLQSLLTANGLSSSKLILKAGIEDRERSRRVEFTIRTATRKTLVRLEEILE